MRLIAAECCTRATFAAHVLDRVHRDLTVVFLTRLGIRLGGGAWILLTQAAVIVICVRFGFRLGLGVRFIGART